MSSAPVVKFLRLSHFCGETPKYQTSGSSGSDVAASISEEIILEPGKRVLVPTGLKLEIPPGFEVQVRPRSGLAFKSGVTIVNSPGTIDSDYRGEVKIILINLGEDPFIIRPGDRIAQLVVMPMIQAQYLEVSQLEETVRGAGGFGSTGVSKDPTRTAF